MMKVTMTRDIEASDVQYVPMRTKTQPKENSP